MSHVDKERQIVHLSRKMPSSDPAASDPDSMRLLYEWMEKECRSDVDLEHICIVTGFGRRLEEHPAIPAKVMSVWAGIGPYTEPPEWRFEPHEDDIW